MKRKGCPAAVAEVVLEQRGIKERQRTPNCTPEVDGSGAAAFQLGTVFVVVITLDISIICLSTFDWEQHHEHAVDAQRKGGGALKRSRCCQKKAFSWSFVMPICKSQASRAFISGLARLRKGF